MELSTRVLLCYPCFGEIVTVEGLAEERDSERTREKLTCLQSNEYFCDAVCGDIARKKSSPKGHRHLPRTKLLKGLEDAQQHNRLAEQ